VAFLWRSGFPEAFMEPSQEIANRLPETAKPYGNARISAVSETVSEITAQTNLTSRPVNTIKPRGYLHFQTVLTLSVILPNNSPSTTQ
jgi:hypothetical protein